MIKSMTKKTNNKKGFTLIELIVVIAIMGILAAIAIPRFTGMRHEASIKAEGTTATLLLPKYMILPASPSYTLGKNATSNLYEVTWTSTVTNYAGSQKVTEGTAWTPTGY